ncbi:GNAT family N-acetyltransferase [Sinorhizobium fredii]|uniref:GNAT family N-acetyltransferase n=1 Tax=Rhizobium fredii TaxID=380 RepID=UPI0030AABF9D
MTLEIAYSRQAADTEAFTLLAEGWNELVQDGYTPDRMGVPPLDWSDEVLYAIGRDGDVIGVLTWRTVTAVACFVVTLAYVEPSSRGNGVFRALLAALRQHAAKAGIGRIVATIFHDNPAGTAACLKTGGSGTAVVYEWDVPRDEKPGE